MAGISRFSARLSDRLSGRFVVDTESDVQSPRSPRSPTRPSSPGGFSSLSPRRKQSKTDEFFQSHPELSLEKIKRSDHEWKNTLSRASYTSLIKKNMEPPYKGKFYNTNPKVGLFVCGGCENPLFDATTLTRSDGGYAAFPPGSIALATVSGVVERGGLLRVEHSCARCGGFLGYNCTQGVEVSSSSIRLVEMTRQEQDRSLKLLKQRAKVMK